MSMEDLWLRQSVHGWVLFLGIKSVYNDYKQPSSETQGRLVGARGNKSGKEMNCRMFTSKAKKAPGNRFLPDHFQTALPMLPPDWAEKSFVLFCPIGEQ